MKTSKSNNKTVYVTEVASSVERLVNETNARLGSYVEPVRESIFKRYPTLFTLLVAFGGIATFLGLEQIILSYSIFSNHPWLLFFIGATILVFTGQLYKKLN
jgi:hypothetical protein